MSTYTVKLNLIHNGEVYEPGAEVELDEKAAAVLVQDGVVEALTGEADDKTNDDTSGAKALEDMTAAELKEEAAKRELPTSGSKADLIERIQEADAASEEGAGDDL